jgi:histidinol-phosphate aminotransferase
MSSEPAASPHLVRSIGEKGGGSFGGIRMLLCENPLPPLHEAVVAAQEVMPHANLYTEAHSAPLRRLISDLEQVREELIHINAGSELILRQLFDRFGERVHLFTPTYALFPEIARRTTITELDPQEGFALDLARVTIPRDSTLVAIVTPNNPTGTVADLTALPELLQEHPETMFLVDEAFYGLGAPTVVSLVPEHTNLVVTRTLSKAQSLAGMRIGYAFCPRDLADELNSSNDAYPLTRPSQAAAIATLERPAQIAARADRLRGWATDLARGLSQLGVRTFPSDTYFFLADFAPRDAHVLADELLSLGVLLKPLDDPRLGRGMVRVTTAVPEDNARFLALLEPLLDAGRPSPSTRQPEGMESLVDATARLRAAGYPEDWEADGGMLRCLGCSTAYAPAEMTVDEIVRFEGPSDPGDETILFALTGPCDHRGLYSAAYGTYTSTADLGILAGLHGRPDADPAQSHH